MRLPVISLLSLALLFCLSDFASSAESDEASTDTNDATMTKSIAPIFDWSEELIKVDVPSKGYRFDELNDKQVAALRRGFKLSLDALIEADSIEELSTLITVRPLPDPSEPFLPVDSASQGNEDPFGENNSASNLGPLDRLFLAEGRLNTEDGQLISQPSSSSDDPFADEDPFGDSSLDSGMESPAAEDETEDPFASDSAEDDAFGDSSSEEEDPFAGF